MSMRAGICVGVWMLVSCQGPSPPVISQPPQSDTPAPVAHPPAAPSVEPQPQPPQPPQPSTSVDQTVLAPGTIHPAHRCKADKDCTNSCSLGAVNTHWYAIHYPKGDRCEDGCTSKGFESPQCQERSCVAYRSGDVVDDCTRQPPAYRGGLRIRPEHRCQGPADCSNTCRFGAVNHTYYQAHRQEFPDCRDGCSSKGTGDADCQNGLCVGYRMGNPDPQCTARPMVADP